MAGVVYPAVIESWCTSPAIFAGRWDVTAAVVVDASAQSTAVTSLRYGRQPSHPPRPIDHDASKHLDVAATRPPQNIRTESRWTRGPTVINSPDDGQAERMARMASGLRVAVAAFQRLAAPPRRQVVVERTVDTLLHSVWTGHRHCAVFIKPWLQLQFDYDTTAIRLRQDYDEKLTC